MYIMLDAIMKELKSLNHSDIEVFSRQVNDSSRYELGLQMLKTI